MSAFVLDCSVGMAWCFEDEADRYVDGVLDRLVGEPAVVPPLWPLEIANVLVVAERRRRLRKSDSARFLELIGALPIEVDSATPDPSHLLAVAREHRLSAYDAAYLALAMREGVPLATRDRALGKAARRCGVSLFAAV